MDKNKMSKDLQATRKTFANLPPAYPVAWAFVILLYNAYEREIYDALWVMVGIPYLALLGAGIGFVLWGIFALIKSRFRSRSAFVTLAVIGVSVTCFRLSVPANLRWHFVTLPRYESHIAKLKGLPGYGQNSYCRKNECSIDRSIDDKVLRVSFNEPGGILDNYTAIVYDPSGLVMRANEFKSNLPNSSNYPLFRVRRLFGGDLFWAKSLGNSWYRCGFT